jgi:hypothetical protein
MQNKAIFYFYFNSFIFEKKVAREKMHNREPICPVPGCYRMPCIWVDYIYHSLLRSHLLLIKIKKIICIDGVWNFAVTKEEKCIDECYSSAARPPLANNTILLSEHQVI